MLAPLISRALRRFGKDVSVRIAAARSWQIEPAVTVTNLPAIFDEADLARVTGVPANTSLAFQVDRVTRTSTAHRPRRAHLLKNVAMVEGHLFRWNLVQPLADRPFPKLSKRGLAPVDSAVLASTEYGNRFFGHWLCDDVPLALTAHGLGRPVGHINADNRPSPHQAAYEALLRPDVELLHEARFRELTILDPAPETGLQGERYEVLRRRLRGDRPPRDNPGVLLLRGTTGQRRVLVNEERIAELVAARGFRVVDPLACTVEQLVEASFDARVVMGVEGSQLTHGFLPMRAGGALLTLQPPFKFDHFWKERCDVLGLRYAFIVGRTMPDGAFEIDLDAVSRMLDRLDASAARSAQPVSSVRSASSAQPMPMGSSTSSASRVPPLPAPPPA